MLRLFRNWNCWLHRTDLRDISITFVENRYPRALFAYLKEVWGLAVTEAASRIYHVTGDKMAIQVIYRKRLSGKENPWLSGLGADLSAKQCGRILRDSEKVGGELSAYMHVVISANPKLMKELMGMKMHPEVRRMLEESGLTQEWLAEGEAKGEAKAEAERQRLMREQERVMRKQERVVRENERLKREIAKLKQAVHAKVKA